VWTTMYYYYVHVQGDAFSDGKSRAVGSYKNIKSDGYEKSDEQKNPWRLIPNPFHSSHDLSIFICECVSFLCYALHKCAVFAK